MDTQNRENFNNVIQYLSNYCWEHNIGLEYNHELPPFAHSKSYTIPGKLIVINANWINEVEIPFIFGHEIGHITENLPDLYHASPIATIQGEAFANRFSISLLKQYCIENDICFDNVFSFAKAFGIPKKYYHLLDCSIYEKIQII